MDTNTAPSKYPICRHIKTNGRRCQSPAVHRATFCHFHRTLHDAHTKGFPPPSALGYLPTEHIEKMLSYGEPLSEIAKAFPSPAAWMSVPPPLEDAESVQVAISLIFADMVSGHVSTERARPLLYALQLASYNFRTLAQIQTRDATADPIPMAHRVVRTRKGHTLSAPNDESDSPSLLPAKAPRRRRLTPPALQPAVIPQPVAIPQSAVDPQPVAIPQSAVDPQPAVILAQPESPYLPLVALGEPTQTHPDGKTWPGRLCDSGEDNPSQTGPNQSQISLEEATLEPIDPPNHGDTVLPAWQTPRNESFSHNSNEMTLMASASSPKPIPSLHLRQQPPARGGGGASNCVPGTRKHPHPSAAKPTAIPLTQTPPLSHPPKVVDRLVPGQRPHSRIPARVIPQSV